ncbi:MAG: succinate dehydrogenase/fumarate reductase iron-sulfur subunit [Verrucomicrobiaceae bacterium]|nr:MAG: succinate dehydrogenase/fumarate reductase iron-sulfur subunit [Verrucomicrobiaceae bacterium]
MNLHLKVWRQKNSQSEGNLVDYEASQIPEDCSFLEMLDIVNEQLEAKGEEPIAFDHDCREGICGTCSLTINGIAHGPSATTTCQLYMRNFKDGDTIYVEPFRARAFPVLKDLMSDRNALDRIQQAGGYITASVGSAPDGNAILVPKPAADLSMEAAACIQCGACVASCPNGSAMLFVGAKVSHFAYLPQGQPERNKRVLAMVRQMDKEGFGNCSNYYECEAVCPADIPGTVITRLNREYAVAAAKDSVGAA